MDLAVIGLGKLGAPLAAVLASRGHRVVGIDLDPQAVAALNAGRAPVQEPGLQERLAMAEDRLRATTDFTAVAETDLSFVIVPTPSGPDGTFSNRFVLDAVRRIGTALRGSGRYHVVNITSTVMPGSTGGEIRAALEQASGLTVGVDVGLTYNPEFIALGSVVRDLLQPDMVLIGESDPRAGDVLAAAYARTVREGTPIQRMNWVCAELTKIAINTYVTTKISYANMIAELCDRLPGADADVVTTALGRDSRIGPKYLKSALGYGGPCFPRDNIALAALARSLGTRADVAEATDAVNRRQVARIATLVARLAPTPTRVAVLGLSYKPDTPVVEESQGLMIARALAEAGHTVLVADPVALDAAMAALGPAATRCDSPEQAVAAAALIVIATPDRAFAHLPPACFAGGKTVIDCWRILPPEIADLADIVHLGRGPALPQGQ
jgi:UDPglucose 6-dehydrogenase